MGDIDPVYVATNKQVANLKYVDDKAASEANKKHSKTEDIELDSTYRIQHLIEPVENHHAVNKGYCDGNSGKGDGGASGFWGFLGGLLGGALSGMLTSLAMQGITSSFGNLAGQGAAAFGSFLNGAM